MWTKILSALLVVGSIGVILGQQQQAQLSECRKAFVQNLYQCASNNSMEVTSFLWLVTNQTSGSAPANMEEFKKLACSKGEDVLKCGFDFMNKLTNSTICASRDEKLTIDGQFQAIFGQLDMVCAHPCRKTLVGELRKCYKTAELDPDLFLSNATMGRGAVIGTTMKDVEQYCAHKDTLTSCMKEKRDNCPEAPIILRAIGLDIESMDTGVNILCSHPKVYLQGIDCFEEPTKGVELCQQEQNNRMVNLLMTAQQTQMKEEVFFENFCGIRVKHVECDLKEWSKKERKSCSKAVIGLRTEMECGLLPKECADSQREKLEVVCHIDTFNRDERNDTGGGASMSVSTSLTAVLLIMSHFIQSH